MAVQYAFGKIVTQGLDLNVDAADPTSYPGTGTSWTSVVNRSITGSLVSCSFSSDFKGGIVFNNPSASVEFPGTVANYGTGSFTIEMAFRPSHIEGIHYLVSKNSGSFPNWGVYLSGSGGSGKLFAEYNINASVSCSVSSSTTFETGSNYFVDTIFSPLEKRVYINVEGNYDAVSITSDGTGSLTTTGSLFLGNLTVSSSQAYSGSIFNTKVYSTFTSGLSNFKSISQRINKPIPARAASALALVVGGGGGAGGGGGNGAQGGGGAGGVIFTTIPLNVGNTNIIVGDGGLSGNNITGFKGNGHNSSILTYVAIGGGGGGNENNSPTGGSGGSGGGGTQGSAAGAGTVNQGFSGSISNGGGGGGGASGLPIARLSTAHDGGPGLFVPLFEPVAGSPSGWFAGGGAGSRNPNRGIGGIGGGGGSGSVNGVANTGGGGGGNLSSTGGRGGSGIVIIRYSGPPIATGGTITSVDGDTIHTFTATGSSTFTVF
jgi:hypothetical protein